MIFEGEYQCEQLQNGKGKIYNQGKLIFEGEFLDGKIWKGKGEVYNRNRELIFEGEY